MRLAVLQRGQGLLQRFLFAVVRVIAGCVPGPIATLSYRPKLFGEPMSAVMQASMRNLKHWRDAEAELFAAYVSRQNECEY
jgi:hypothetical protein